MERCTGMKNRLRTQIPKLDSPFKYQLDTDAIPNTEETTSCSNPPDKTQLVKIKKPNRE